MRRGPSKRKRRWLAAPQRRTAALGRRESARPQREGGPRIGRPGSGRSTRRAGPAAPRVALTLGLLLAAACGGEASREQAQALQAVSAASPAPEGVAPAVRIAEPEDGAVVPGPDVHVVLSAEGIEIVPATERRPGTGHHHLFIDTDLSPPDDTIPQGVTGIIHLGRGQTEFTIQRLAPGEHRVIALVADADHIPIKPLVADTVRFTVQR